MTDLPALLRILMIEDSDTDAVLVTRALRALARPLEITRVQEPAEMRRALSTHAWDVVLCDWSMPNFSAPAALRVLQESGLDLPFIIVSGTIGEEHAVDAMRAGAHDYVLKDKLARLPPAIEREVRESRVRAGRAAVAEQLRASEARYRRIIEATSEGIWMIGTDHLTTFVNARMAEILGRGPAEIMGRNPSDFYDDEGREYFRRMAAEGRIGQAHQLELGLIRPDGSRVWVLLDSSPLRDVHGVHEGSLAMVKDISARKEAEAARRTTEARFRGLWESGVLLITIVGSSGQILDLNEAGAGLLGYAREELVGSRRWADLTPARWRSADARGDEQLRRTGAASAYEKELSRKDGTLVSVLTTEAMVSDDEHITIAVDVTERKRAELALGKRASIAGLTADVAIALSDHETLREALQRCTDGIVQHLGAASARIWLQKRDKNELELHATAGLVPPAETGSDPTIVDREWAMREGLRGYSGRPLLVAGDLIGVLGVAARTPIDPVVTDGLAAIADTLAIGVQRKRMERANAELELQLRQAQKMEAVGRLAGGVAHDFNNILSVILSYAQLLLDDLKADDPMRADIVEIHTAAIRAADLTRQLLMFSRQQVLEPKNVDLNELLASMEKMLRRIVGEDVAVALVPAPDLGLVHIDPGSLEQVVMNLVVNARDAMPRGGRLVIETKNVVLDEAYARAHVGAKPGPHVTLSVKDTGEGMDAAVLEHIFEPFFTTKDLGKGTGLGLSTVFGIAQQSGGCIVVDSAPGAGTRFDIHLPRTSGPRTETADQVSFAPRPGSETILVVEDEDQVRVVVCGTLRRQGYLVLEAADAEEALRLSAEHPGVIDLLLTDVVMPGMSGPDLAKTLVATRPDMRVLCMSGYMDDSVVRHGVEVAEIAFLQKPLTPTSLSTKVRDVLDAPLRPSSVGDSPSA